LTLSSYIIDNIAIKPVNVISEAVSIRTEMKNMHEEYLWIHANEIEDIFPLQDIFGLHPLKSKQFCIIINHPKLKNILDIFLL
jgi:hypothetical protein